MCTETPQPSKLSFSVRVCIWKWRIWDTLLKSWNVHLDSAAFKAKLLNKSLCLEIEDLGHLIKILKCWNVHLGFSAVKTKLLHKCWYKTALEMSPLCGVLKMSVTCCMRRVLWKEMLSSTSLMQRMSILNRSFEYHGGSGTPGQNPVMCTWTPPPSKLSF